MPAAQEPHHVAPRVARPPRQHGLGPHVVGQRVVVRRIVRGETGPSGGPALTDLLGTCLAWGEAACVIQPASGPPVTIALADVVSGKPVPPRPSVRDRVPARDAQLRGLALFADLETRPLGDWVLRRSPTAGARRANSVLAFGPSGLADDDAHDRVVAFYAGVGQRPIAAVLPGSAEADLFAQRGWVPESADADTVFQVTAVSLAARALRGALRGARPADVEVVVDDVAGQAVAHVVEAGVEVAGGTAAFDRDWVGFRGIEVTPEHRRRGLGLAVMGALLEWGAERGATTAYLQVLGDNAPALALYERLGFREHHRYRYLAAGG